MATHESESMAPGGTAPAGTPAGAGGYVRQPGAPLAPRYRRNEYDYFYGEVNSPTSIAAQTANPSALGLLAFGLTTALLQGDQAMIQHVFQLSPPNRQLFVMGMSVRISGVCIALRFVLLAFAGKGANTTWAEASAENSTTHVTYAYALFFGGLVQLLAGMWEFRRNNMFAATAFSCYGGFWLGYGIYGVLASSGALPESGPRSLEMLLALWGILTFGLMLVSLGTNVALFLLFFFLTCTFMLLCGGVRNPTGGANKTGGWFGVWTASIAFYIAFAELLNEVWFHGQPKVPLGNFTWHKRFATEEDKGNGSLPTTRKNTEL